MDDKNKDVNMYIFGLYAIFSFICVMITILLVHIICVKKYKLNWFEKNLLETANLNKTELNESQELFVCKEEKHRPSSLTEVISNSESNENIRSSCNSLNSNVSVPIARNEKHIVLMAGSPVKPRIASMHGKLDLSQIDCSLYEKLSPDKEDDEDIRGAVHVTLNYDSLSGILTVKLIEAQDLKARDFSGTADPYAKIRLLPDKTNVWQTKIHKKTLNPIFDEDFVFEVTPAQLHRNVLEVLLFDFDAYSRHQNIGGVQIALESVDLNEKTDFWKSLGPVLHQDPHIHLGELLVSLAYLPSAERLTVVIVKARNLKVVDETRNSSDPYVKVCLVNGTKRLKKRKTSIHRNTVNPIFNEAITFDVEKDTLGKSDIEFYIIHDSLLGVGEILGKSRIGFSDFCREEEKNFFTEILHNKTATAKWLTLLEPQ